MSTKPMFTATMFGSAEAARDAEVQWLRAENEALRDLLCNAHAGVWAYRDDGELQDNTAHPCIDFKRHTPEQIRSALQRRSEAARAARGEG
jgi:hypothetical protein